MRWIGTRDYTSARRTRQWCRGATDYFATVSSLFRRYLRQNWRNSILCDDYQSQSIQLRQFRGYFPRNEGLGITKYPVVPIGKAMSAEKPSSACHRSYSPPRPSVCCHCAPSPPLSPQTTDLLNRYNVQRREPADKERCPCHSACCSAKMWTGNSWKNWTMWTRPATSPNTRASWIRL